MGHQPHLNIKNDVLTQLEQLKHEFEHKHLTSIFAEDSQRFQNFSVNLEPIIFDYSKHRVNQKAIDALVQWADVQELKPWIKKLFSVDAINYTEQRAAMHWALRLPQDDVTYPHLAGQVHEQLQRMFSLVEKFMQDNVVESLEK